MGNSGTSEAIKALRAKLEPFIYDDSGTPKLDRKSSAHIRDEWKAEYARVKGADIGGYAVGKAWSKYSLAAIRGENSLESTQHRTKSNKRQPIQNALSDEPITEPERAQIATEAITSAVSAQKSVIDQHSWGEIDYEIYCVNFHRDYRANNSAPLNILSVRLDRYLDDIIIASQRQSRFLIAFSSAGATKAQVAKALSSNRHQINKALEARSKQGERAIGYLERKLARVSDAGINAGGIGCLAILFVPFTMFFLASSFGWHEIVNAGRPYIGFIFPLALATFLGVPFLLALCSSLLAAPEDFGDLSLKLERFLSPKAIAQITSSWRKGKPVGKFEASRLAERSFSDALEAPELKALLNRYPINLSNLNFLVGEAKDLIEVLESPKRVAEHDSHPHPLGQDQKVELFGFPQDKPHQIGGQETAKLADMTGEHTPMPEGQSISSQPGSREVEGQVLGSSEIDTPPEEESVHHCEDVPGQTAGSMPIDLLELGVTKTARLKDDGIFTIEDFLGRSEPQLLKIKGMGRGAIAKGLARIEELGLVAELAEQHASHGATVTTLPTALAELPIGVLHLGVKTERLIEADVKTIGDVNALGEYHIANLRTLGRQTASLAIERISHLVAAYDQSEELDWAAYCESISLPLIGQDDDHAFIDAIPDFISAVADNLEDPTAKRILIHRVIKPPREQSTLEEIAREAVPPISRERVRQKERKLLRQITGGLLDTYYVGLEMHFHPYVCKKWQDAAAALEQFDELDVSDLVETLALVWSTDQNAVHRQLPTILALITGKAIMPDNFRQAAQLNQRLFGEIHEEVTDLSVRRLRLGKYAEQLADEGFDTFGKCLEGLREGALSASSGKSGAEVAKHANIMASCLEPNGRIDWVRYRELCNLPTLPEVRIRSAGEFVDTLRSTINELLAPGYATMRASDIYQMRTCRTRGSQLTLQAVADKLATHGPTIKREETIFLRQLNEAIVEKDFSKLPYWLDESWLSYWKDAEICYSSHSTDYKTFSENLAWKWRLTEKDCSKAVPTLWAVLSGYPRHRWAKKTEREQIAKVTSQGPSSQPTISRVQLRGFRRVH